MLSRRFIAFTLLLLLWVSLACQLIPTPPPLQDTPAAWLTPATAVPQPPGAIAAPTSLPVPTQAALTPDPGSLAPFPPTQPFASLEVQSWQPAAALPPVYTLPASLEQVANPQVVAGLTNTQRDFLVRNGFVVLHSQEERFSLIRERVATRFGQPYYLTTDAAIHAFHLTLDELRLALEREELYPRLYRLTSAVLEQVLSYQPLVQDTPLQVDVQLAASYLSVALRLFDPQAALPSSLEASVRVQVAQVLRGQPGDSTLIPGYRDNFRLYQPVGYYVADKDLQAYFRGLAWLRRASFQAQPAAFLPSRAPLVLTLALRRASVDGLPADQEWAAIHETLAFLDGVQQEIGPAQYASLMDQVYGTRLTIVGLQDEAHWISFQDLSQQLPLPLSQPGLADALLSPAEQPAWRFFGQPSDLDAAILSSLVFDRVSTPENPRTLPSGLDVMAALGSPAAIQALEEASATAYAGYADQMARLQRHFQSQPPAAWRADAYGGWLYALASQLVEKRAASLPFLRHSSWADRDLNSTLGAWAALQHATTTFLPRLQPPSSQAPPSSSPAPAYVEPNPLLFYRLAWLADALVQGLQQRGMTGDLAGDPEGLNALWIELGELGDRFHKLGDIAAKELEGQPLVEDDYVAIQAPLGMAEERHWLSQLQSLRQGGVPLQPPPVAVLSAFQGGAGAVLQVGVGLVDRIYVLVPIDGRLSIAQGGVFSYYEFPQTSAELFSDREWRQVVLPSLLELPAWTASYIFPDGSPLDVLAFRIGDVYRLTPSGARLNVRAGPSRGAEVLGRLKAGDYVIIVDGPVQAGGFTWWKLDLPPFGPAALSGWVVEDQAYFERAWGQ